MKMVMMVVINVRENKRFFPSKSRIEHMNLLILHVDPCVESTLGLMLYALTLCVCFLLL